MSARPRRGFGPKQQFKKRIAIINAQLASGSISTATITIKEAGTIYAVRFMGSWYHNKGLTATNRVISSLQVGRSGFTTTPILTGSTGAIETGDILALVHGVLEFETVTPLAGQFALNFDRKYRFRRTVAADDQIKVVSENIVTVGSATDASIAAWLTVWIRTK